MGSAVPQRRNYTLSMKAEIEAKPEGSIWSDDQWRAIAESGDDILVAAAAGSGKTAVLVERIIRKISKEENGFSVDRLLVATFTKAAAAEMRQRIRKPLIGSWRRTGRTTICAVSYPCWAKLRLQRCTPSVWK